MDKIKVRNFNDLPFEERQRIAYYTERGRLQAFNQVLSKLKNDIGYNQKEKITRWISNIESGLAREYEVIKPED